MVYQRKYRLCLLCLLTNSKCVPIKLYKEDCGKWDLKLNFAKRDVNKRDNLEQKTRIAYAQ